MRSLTFPVRAVSRFNPLRVLANNMFASPFFRFSHLSLFFSSFFFLYLFRSRETYFDVFRHGSIIIIFFIVFKLVRNTSLLLQFNCKCGLFAGTWNVFSLFIFNATLMKKWNGKRIFPSFLFCTLGNIFYFDVKIRERERRFLFNFSAKSFMIRNNFVIYLFHGIIIFITQNIKNFKILFCSSSVKNVYSDNF